MLLKRKKVNIHNNIYALFMLNNVQITKDLYISLCRIMHIYTKMAVQVRITVSKEIDILLEKVAKKLGKKKSQLARELMEQKMYDLSIIQRELEA